ncbi:SIMPL domain-containing protein [Vallitalea okinawensis]|uniref:SIMPL domain-containing protein n=1 Tax=Vallitalea okinawensis TaxID=2078660 RepID=UPI000CFCE712|nr:SIMPL domain-containing protein [Vallitalea okinawensis]
MYYNMYRDLVPRIKKKKTINVIGVGTKIVKSDMAVLIFDMVTESIDPFQALENSGRQIEEANSTLKQFGIKEEDIFYTRDELMPSYDQSDEIITYKASTIYRVLFYDMQLLSEILFNVKGAKGRVTEVIFTVKDPVKYYNEALDLAVSDALVKATKIAEEMGIIIDDTPQNITETTNVHDLLMGVSHQHVEDTPKFMEGFITFFATVEAEFLELE